MDNGGNRYYDVIAIDKVGEAAVNRPAGRVGCRRRWQRTYGYRRRTRCLIGIALSRISLNPLCAILAVARLATGAFFALSPSLTPGQADAASAPESAPAASKPTVITAGLADTLKTGERRAYTITPNQTPAARLAGAEPRRPLTI